MSFVNSYEDLAPQNLAVKQKALSDLLKVAKDLFEERLHEAITAQREKVAEKDEKAKGVLDFIKKIGFDLIPQKYTEQMITEIQAGQLNI